MALRRSTLLSATLAIWLVAYAVWTADVLVEDVPFPIDRAFRRLPLCLGGAAICLCLAPLLARVRTNRPRYLLPVAAAGVVVCSLIFSMLNEFTFFIVAPRWGPPAPIHIPDVAMMDGWVFLAWTLLFLAISADADRRNRELALAHSEAAALDAQHRLLLSQAQPHFLFNALNTIYALVLEEDVKGAGRAVLALSDYLRRSLQCSGIMSTLGAELDATRDYLAIEQLRFGERLRVTERVEREALRFPLPSFALQPVVENSIRHGLGGSVDPVTITLRAELEGEGCRVVVEDDAQAASGTGGSGVGLASVERRLHEAFGTGATLSAGRRPEGGFRTTILVADAS